MSIELAKKAAAEKAVVHVQDNMVVGLGTGSTTFYAIEAIGKRVAEGLQIKGVPTSLQTAELARQMQIPLLDEFTEIDMTIDGADEIDGAGNLVKGGGGALTREKIVAAASKKEIIIADEGKLVKTLGKFPLPVEVLPFGWQSVQVRLQQLGCEVTLRQKNDEVFVSDNGNFILDCHFGEITSPQELAGALNAVAGVVENGLFVGLTAIAIIANTAGEAREIIY